LREINEMRIKTLEKIIKEKVQSIQNLEGEVDRQYRQIKNLEKLVEERE
jgi:N-glycosylase/DNA lyase